MDVSIVIPVKNGGELLDRVLAKVSVWTPVPRMAP